MYQAIAWQISVIGVLAIALVFLFVFLRSGEAVEYAPVQRRFYRIRTVWFIVLLVLGVWLSAETLPHLPYAATHGRAGAEPAVTVDVTGHQWYWEMDPRELPAGRRVAFRVTAADVNHGFAIYNEDSQVVAQTQAMPGYVNELRHTFREPGTYTVMCLEYCGLAHHRMITTFQVVEAEA